MLKKIKIILDKKFFLPQTEHSKIKPFQSLDIDERNSFFIFLEYILKNNSLLGKNKASDSTQRYDPVTKTIIEIRLIHPAASYFSEGKIWHYHLNTKTCPYKTTPNNHLTYPILLKNLQGKTSDFLVHYVRDELEHSINLTFLGISPHQSWQELHQFLENNK